MSKMHEEWKDRIRSGVLTKAQIQRIYNEIWARGMGRPTFVRAASLSDEECANLVKMIRLVEPHVTQTQADQGNAWLRKNGKKLGMPESVYKNDAYSFRFVGCKLVYSNGFRTQYSPIYVGEYDGFELRYTASAWQTGRTDTYFEIKETQSSMTAYDEGYTLGEYRREHDDYDPRWDFADAARNGDFAEFKRGFEAGFDGEERA
jgi:hypothetical protein